MKSDQSKLEKVYFNENHVYNSVRSFVVEARREIYKSVNEAMVLAYWNIGKTIYEACGVGPCGIRSAHFELYFG